MRKYLFEILLLATFLLLSVVLLLDWDRTNSGLPSYRLSIQKTETGNTETITYIDGIGRRTNATDVGYASIVKTYQEDGSVLEKYYDSDGKPAKQSPGHYALLRYYNSDGQNDRIVFLDKYNNPTMLSAGYAEIHREYYYKNVMSEDVFFDLSGRPVSCENGYYAFLRDYDTAGHVNRITYLDENEQPVLCSFGYAIVERTYNEAGQVSYEYYYDTEHKPVTNISGAYGIYREYDEYGNTVLTTYLNNHGQSIANNQGIVTIRQTYNYDGTLSTVRYFDEKDNPKSVGRNQYGYEYVQGRTVYLDDNGNRMIRFDNFLNTHPLAVVLLGLIAIVTAILIHGKGRVVFIFVYILFIGIMTLWYRETGESRGVFDLFWSYKYFFTNRELREGIIYNIWLFIPLGSVLWNQEYHWTWLLAVLLSVTIELVQYIFGLGLFEFDDILSNILGAIIGFFIANSYHNQPYLKIENKIQGVKN